MPTADVHQHLWPDAFISTLSRREEPPSLDGPRLELAGEEAIEIDLAAHGLEARLALLDRFEIDVAVISLPPTLGIGALAENERAELVEAYEHGILELAAASHGRLVPLAAGRAVDEFAGACIGAPELLELESIAALLDTLERRGAFLFVHPGATDSPAGKPAW